MLKQCKKGWPEGSVCNTLTGRCNKIKAARSRSPKQPVKSPKAKTEKIYHPFYRKKIPIDSFENCGHDRPRLSKSYFGKEIERYVSGLLQSAINNLYILASAVASKKDKIDERLNDSVLDAATDVSSMLMDIYTLSRIFRKFKEGSKPSGIQNVIIYVGGNHADRYANFI